MSTVAPPPPGHVVVLLEGAPEPLQPWPSTLGAAVTPTLDALCHAGRVGRLDTTSGLLQTGRRRPTVVCGPGAATTLGALLGLDVVVPPGATGDVDTDLAAKADAALALAESGADVVVHVGAIDAAARRRDRHAKLAAIQLADAELVSPLARSGVRMAVTSSHGACPWTGRRDAQPAPFVVAGPGIAAHGPRRLSERAVERCPVETALWPAYALTAVAG